jgi:hypothetical protein
MALGEGALVVQAINVLALRSSSPKSRRFSRMAPRSRSRAGNHAAGSSSVGAQVLEQLLHGGHGLEEGDQDLFFEGKW